MFYISFFFPEIYNAIFLIRKIKLCFIQVIQNPDETLSLATSADAGHFKAHISPIHVRFNFLPIFTPTKKFFFSENMCTISGAGGGFTTCRCRQKVDNSTIIPLGSRSYIEIRLSLRLRLSFRRFEVMTAQLLTR